MNLTNDFAFKRVFGEPDGSRGLKALINAIVRPAFPMAQVEVENAEIAPDSALGKTVRLDLLVRSDQGQRINIEMQTTPQGALRERTLLYWSRMFDQQTRRGQGYDILSPCIAIQLLNFTAIGSTNRFHTSYHVTEDHERFRWTEDLEIHWLELPKFRATVRDVRSTARDDLGKWLLMLNASDQEGWVKALEDAAKTDLVLQETLAVWEAASQDFATWKRYNDRDLILRDIYQYRKEGYEDGVKEGFEDGVKEGFEEGVKEGFEDGIKEGFASGEQAKARAIARKMLAEGVSVSLVAEVTGLSRSVIESLDSRLGTDPPEVSGR